MLRHVSVIRWKDGASPAEQSALLAAIRALPEHVPGIRSYVVAEDAGIDSDTADFVVIADFDDAEGYRHYRDHPDHAVVKRDLRRLMETRSAVQVEVP